jgi:hypothetical protein
MSRKFLVPIDLNSNELQNAVIGSSSSDPSNVAGRIYYNNATPSAGVLKFYNGTAWQTVATGGSSVYVGSTQFTIGNSSGSVTTLSGMSTITSTTFVGALTGNADTATSATTAAALSPGANINGVGFTGASNITITANTAADLTVGTGLQLDSGTTFNGGGARTISINSNVVTTTGTQTLTNKTFTTPTIQSGGAVFQGTTGNTTVVANTTASGTLTLPAATGTLATTSYVDTSIANSQAGFNVHTAVRVASTANITGTYTAGTSDQSQGTGIGATFVFTTAQIDSVTLAANDRVLLKNQTNQIHNGIYAVTGTPGANVTLTRATDFDNSVAGEVFPGDLVYVTAGTINGGSTWAMNATGTATTPANAIKIGTDNIVWAQFAGTTGGVLPVTNGGTGASTLTLNGVLIGNTTGAIVATTAGGADSVLRVPSAGGTPAFGAIDISKANAVTGTLAVGSGGTGATTFTSGALLKGAGTGAITVASGTDITTAIGANAVTLATNASNVTIADDTATNAVLYPLFTSTATATGNVASRVSSTKLTYNPSTGTLSSTIFVGPINTGSNGNTVQIYQILTGGTLRITGSLTTGTLELANGTSFGGTLALGSGVTTSGTKSISLGANGDTGSTTSITINTNAGTPTTTINGTVKLGATAFATDGLVRTSSTNGTLSIATAGTHYVVSVAGTTNQITVSGSNGILTLSTPQNIHTAATPQFAGIGLGTTAPAAGITVSGGKITAAAGVTGYASLLIAAGSADPTSPVSGDVWNNAGVLKFRDASSVSQVVALAGSAGTTLNSTITFSSLTRVAPLSSGTAGYVKVDASGNLTSVAETPAKKYTALTTVTYADGVRTWSIPASTHGLGASAALLVQVYDTTSPSNSMSQIETDVYINTTGTGGAVGDVTIGWTQAGGTAAIGAYRVVIIG